MIVAIRSLVLLPMSAGSVQEVGMDQDEKEFGDEEKVWFA
jgi:hypothetical protein